MTTTPTAFHTLPDLERLEALARAATPGPWVYQENSDAYTHIVRPVQSPGRIVRHYAHDESGVVEANARFTAGANPAAVLALIALARRAQPEGEAPQAELSQVAALLYSALNDAYQSSMFDGEELKRVVRALSAYNRYRSSPAATLSPLCGAQHAESGALYSYMGESGQYELLGKAVGAGKCRLVEPLTVYRDTATGNLYFRDAADFAERMVAIGGLAAQQAASPGALALLNAGELAALHRFQETCQDFDSGGYDVDKGMMKRLAAIGVIESKGFNRYQFTEFGDYVVENQAPSAPGTPEAPKGGVA